MTEPLCRRKYLVEVEVSTMLPSEARVIDNARLFKSFEVLCSSIVSSVGPKFLRVTEVQKMKEENL
ncbi:MAG: hypothetical protein ABR951_10015 [Candidatus Aminicenantales bacterium]|jgi:hypothetical protein